jgi:hypothetical protein
LDSFKPATGRPCGGALALSRHSFVSTLTCTCLPPNQNHPPSAFRTTRRLACTNPARFLSVPSSVPFVVPLRLCSVLTTASALSPLTHYTTPWPARKHRVSTIGNSSFSTYLTASGLNNSERCRPLITTTYATNELSDLTRPSHAHRSCASRLPLFPSLPFPSRTGTPASTTRWT